jgi:D-threonate/D-erythronate kinase
MSESGTHAKVGMSGSSLPFSSLRMLADDLTGALDTAAQFACQDSPVSVILDMPEGALPDSLVMDCATRELNAGDAVIKARAGAALLDAAPGRLCFFKIDSLLRGHPFLELAESLKPYPQRRCILAPALPYQNRVTRGGRQYARFAQDWVEVGENIASALRQLGLSCDLGYPGNPIPKGISLWDSETDADLDAIVDAGLACDTPVLWCGSAGLAGALARRHRLNPAPVQLKQPLLGIFGSNHPVMLGQIAHDAESRISNKEYKAGETAWVTFPLPADIDRTLARAHINSMAAEMIAHSPPPGTLVVSGGETLRGLAQTLQVASIAVIGQLEPGIPVARLVGGPWHNTMVVAKSGAFGTPDFLTRLRQKASA